jgi:hypothetical protein
LDIYPANAPPIGFQRCGERLGDFDENRCAANVADGCQFAVPLLWSAGVVPRRANSLKTISFIRSLE